VKRSPALADLSRDHQHALAAALRLRRADETTVASAVEHFLAFFAREGDHHFDVEEECLVPALLPGDAEWAEAVARMLAEHVVIREGAGALDGTADRVELARSLGQLLDAHVRFEERVLFDILERRLSPDRLRSLAAALQAADP
jgi:hemerythrin-like domain-containing protein